MLKIFFIFNRKILMEEKRSNFKGEKEKKKGDHENECTGKMFASLQTVDSWAILAV